jgi:hypothetical protein
MKIYLQKRFAERIGKFPDAMLFLSLSGFNKQDDMIVFPDDAEVTNLEKMLEVLLDKVNLK